MLIRKLFATAALAFVFCAAHASAQVTAIRAGRLVDPEAGTAAENQVILVEGGKVKAVGGGLAVPPRATCSG
jgi:imidazolonepropionase-like amidohydrolase